MKKIGPGKKYLKWLPILILLALMVIPVFSQEEMTTPARSVEGVSQSNTRLELSWKNRIIEGVPFDLTVKAVRTVDGNEVPVRNFNETVMLKIDGGEVYQESKDRKQVPFEGAAGFENGVLKISNVIIKKGGTVNIMAQAGDLTGSGKAKMIPGLLTILPPLLAIILALTLKQVMISLFAGVWLGAAIIYDFNPFISFLRVLDKYIIKALADSDHVSIIVFSLFLGGMVAIISESGGSQGMVNVIRKWANSPRSGQIATWAMGLLIFFDDYANTLIVGNSMRPLTDKLKISREKLSFLVDATAAPVTNVAIISTWIGFEIGVIGDSFKALGINREPYSVFLETIPYRFYPVLLIIFVFMVGYLMRDFGPMLKAERRARKTGKVLAPGAKPLSTIDAVPGVDNANVPERWINAVVPIASVIIFTIIGLYYSGRSGLEGSGAVGLFDKMKVVLNNANSFHVLLWASFGGTVVAGIMVLAQKILSLEDTVSAWMDGAKSIMPAIVILTMAWAIGGICKELNTGGYLALLANDKIAPQLLPFIIFVLSAVIAFATGTSWGTMSIVMPIAVVVGFKLPPAEMAEGLKNAILLGSVSGVLAGATFGDHCSPISDTTIMSSMASAADHIDHVRTQMPYAITVAAIGIVFGSIPAGYGLNPVLCLLISTVVMFLVLKFIGRNPDEDDPLESTRMMSSEMMPNKLAKE